MHSGILTWIIILCGLLCFSMAFKVEDKILQTQKADILLQNPRLNDVDFVQRGASIDDNFIIFVKKHLQQAFVFFNDYEKSQAYVYQRLNETYPGEWMIFFIGQIDDTIVAVPKKDFDFTSYSVNGSWWMYIRGGLNKYQPLMSYYFTRTSTSYPFNNYTSRTVPYGISNPNFTSCEGVIGNIVHAAQILTSNLSEELTQIQQNIQLFYQNRRYSMFLSDTSSVRVPFARFGFLLYVYGGTYQTANYLSRTDRNQYMFFTI